MSRRDPRPRSPEAGFTLIELMASIAIGLGISATALSFYVSTLDARRSIDARLELQESRYFVAQVLVQYLRQAGHRPLRLDMIDGAVLPVRAAGIAFPAGDGWAAGQSLRAVDDGFALRYVGSSTLDADGAPVPDGSITDCAGARLGDAERGSMSFTLEDGALVCTARRASLASALTASAADIRVTLAGDGSADAEDGVRVEDMYAVLGLDDDGDASGDRTVRLEAHAADAAGEPVSIELHVLVASADGALSAPEAYTFDAEEATPEDTRLRRDALVHVALRNR